MRKFVLLLIALAILFGVPRRLDSFPAVGRFSGSVTRIYDPFAQLPASVAIGAPAQGGYYYELDGVTVRFPGPNIADYIFVEGGLSIWVDIAGISWSGRNGGPPTPQVSVVNDNALLGGDEYTVFGWTAVAFPFELGFGRQFLWVRDTTLPQTLVPNLDLPTTNEDIAWGEATLKGGAVYCAAGEDSLTWRIDYQIDSIEFLTTDVERETWSRIKQLYR